MVEPEAIDILAPFLELYLEERATPLWLELFFKGLISLVRGEDYRSQLALREAVTVLSSENFPVTLSFLQDMAAFKTPFELGGEWN